MWDWDDEGESWGPPGVRETPQILPQENGKAPSSPWQELPPLSSVLPGHHLTGGKVDLLFAFCSVSIAAFFGQPCPVVGKYPQALCSLA